MTDPLTPKPDAMAEPNPFPMPGATPVTGLPVTTAPSTTTTGFDPVTGLPNPTPESAKEAPTLREPDGIHCRFCGEDTGTIAVGGSEYRDWWDTHEARAHRIEAIIAAIDANRPPLEIIRAIVTELL